MKARELFQSGKLKEAVQALSAEIRDNPADHQGRTFLFELLCFSGDYERALKHLDILSRENSKAELGALLYRAALAAEKSRQELFRNKTYPSLSGPSCSSGAPSGTLNGRPFRSFVDADPRIGSRLEVYVAGQYVWIPFQHIAGVEMGPPRQLRDLLWASAVVRTGPSCKDRELGEVLLPALSPLSWQHPSDAVKLGRATEWMESDEQEAVPFGQKMFLVDEEEVMPILEIRTLEFASPETASNGHASS